MKQLNVRKVLAVKREPKLGESLSWNFMLEWEDRPSITKQLPDEVARRILSQWFDILVKEAVQSGIIQVKE